MKIDELKKISEENDYEFYESLEYKTITLTREISVDGFITNHITINSKTENQVFIGNGHCDEKDLNMIKVAVKDKLKEAEETDVYLDDIEILEEEKHFPDLMYQASQEAAYQAERDLQESQYLRDLI